MGISFAIPMDEAVRVSEQLRATGRVSRGRIGVQIDQVSKDVAESIGLGKPRGALVRAVEPGAPADKAGVEPGDIIVRFDGKPVEKSTDLPRVVGGTKPGTKTTLTVFRRGVNKDLTVTVAEIEPEKPARKAEAPRADKPVTSEIGKELGLTVSELTPAQRKELGQRGGVLVVTSTDAAARAGIREGDVILQLGNTLVPDVGAFESALSKADKSKPLGLLVRRGELAQILVIRPERP